MGKLKSIIFALVFSASIANLWANQSINPNTTNLNANQRANQTTDSQITAFAMMPPLTALLEILYPQGMIGLNYAPYPEDKEFMPKNVAKLPVIGMQKGNEPIFEKLIALKPSVIFLTKARIKRFWIPTKSLAFARLK